MTSPANTLSFSSSPQPLAPWDSAAYPNYLPHPHRSYRRLLWASLGLTVLLFVALDRLIPWMSPLMLLFIIMVGYMVWLGIQLKRVPATHPQPLVDSELASAPWVSILVAAHNEESVVTGLLDNLRSLIYTHKEIIVVNDRSTDATATVLEQYVAQLSAEEKSHITLVHRSEGQTPGKSAVLNEALQLAKGDLIAIFDADARVATDFLNQLVPYFNETTVAGVQARKQVGDYHRNWLAECQGVEMTMDAYIQEGRDTLAGAVEFRGNGQMVCRKALQRVGGWNEATLTDDLDLSTRLHIAGYTIRFCSQAKVLEESVPQYGGLLRQRRRWGEGSLVRYLDYLRPVFQSPYVSVRDKADLIAYLIEFLLPIWVVVDAAYLLVLEFWVRDPNHWHLWMTLFALPGLGVFFYGLIISSLRRFERHLGWVETLRQATVTAFYLVVLWIPVVWWVTVRLMTDTHKPFDWGKTQHVGMQPA
ncbi:MAG: glycosyltransferase [Vampirovibrionales bacterium]|nr:glycosyltransferase [Vampirovibrionales bacterium]